MKTASAKSLECRYCKKQITIGKVIYTGAGPMHLACFERQFAEVQARIREAIQQGTHCPIRQVRFFCDGCREMVEAIFYVSFDKKRLCYDCTPNIIRDQKPG